MHRFFLPPSSIQSQAVTFPADTAHQVLSVLRLKPGQRVTVLDNLGSQFEVELSQVERGEVTGTVISVQPAAGEPRLHLAMYLCLSQREKFEWMLQKCTEVGAAEFIPVISSRTLVQDREEKQDRAARKQERLERILREAAEQSHRGRIPSLSPALRFDAALADARRHPLRLIPWEQEAALSLRDALHSAPPPSSAAVLIGPEGGFSESEVSAARAVGFLPVTLGPRILRMETAAIVSAALLLHELDNFVPK
jgi:16S rRNA (uracil1498-N3)-methyltransferase